MAEWALLPEHVDLPRYEEIQQEGNQRDCHVGVMSRLWRWVSSHQGLIRRFSVALATGLLDLHGRNP